MLRGYALKCDVLLESHDFNKVMQALRNDDWHGIQEQARGNTKDLAVSAGLEIPPGLDLSGGIFREVIGIADVFFKSGNIYYAQIVPANVPRISFTDIDDLLYSLSTSRRREISGSKRIFEIGIVSNQDIDLESNLQQLATSIENAVTHSLDGRRSRHLTFNWEPRQAPRSRMDVVKERFEEEGAGLSITNAALEDEKLTAADVLKNEANRALLFELKTAVFAREADVLARRGAKQEEARVSLDALKSSGLVKSEHLLQCRKTSSMLIRVDSKDELSVPSVAQLTCAGCSRKFADELVSEGYSVSELGRELSNGSHWMTLWVTQRLIEAGVPLDSIAWNLEESGEEVDIMVDFMGELWLIELKDREFGAGDAHPFNYRTVRYRSNRSFIVSTNIVSPDAKRVFAELNRSSARRPGGSQPVYIEGLEKVAALFQGEVQRVSSNRAHSHLKIPELLTGYTLSRLIE